MADYVNGRELFTHLKEYHKQYLESVELNQEKPQIDATIASAIVQIATRLSNAHNFVNYTYKDEMVSDAILKCLAKVHRFNPEISENPFAFFTQISWQCFIGRIKLEQHQCSVKAKMIRNKMSSEFVEHGVDFTDEDSSNSFVEFLLENDAYVDYYELAKERDKNPPATLGVHKNKTPYKKKVVAIEPPLELIDLSIFEE